MIIELKNGIKVIIIEKKTNIISLSYFIKTGMFNKSTEQNNYTHLYEHILASFTSKDRCDYKDINNELSKSVIESNAHVKEFQTNVWINGYYNDIERLLTLLIKSLFNGCFSKEQFEIEKKAVIQELRQILTNNGYKFEYEIDNFFYKKSFFDVMNGIKNMKKVTMNDIEKFYEKILSKKQIVFGCVCPIKKTKDVIRKFEKCMKDIEYKKPKNEIQKSISFSREDKIVFIKNTEKTDDIYIKFYIPLEYTIRNYILVNIWLIYFFNINYGPIYIILRKKLKLIYSYRKEYFNNEINKRNSLIKFETHTIKLKEVYENTIEIVRNTKISMELFETSKKRYLYKMEKNKEKVNVHYSLLNKEMNYKEFIKMIKKIGYEDFEKFIEKMKKKPIYTFYYSNKKMI